MIGTLIGLIVMLSELDNPDLIGSGMAVALITTFYGSVASNLIFLPIAGKLRIKTEEEILMKQIMIEGILSIQAGETPDRRGKAEVVFPRQSAGATRGVKWKLEQRSDRPCVEEGEMKGSRGTWQHLRIWLPLAFFVLVCFF